MPTGNFDNAVYSLGMPVSSGDSTLSTITIPVTCGSAGASGGSGISTTEAVFTYPFNSSEVVLCSFGQDSDVYCVQRGVEFFVEIAEKRDAFPISPECLAHRGRAIFLTLKDVYESVRHVTSIGLPWDGREYRTAHLDDLLERMGRIKKMGYRVPSSFWLTLFSKADLI